MESLLSKSWDEEDSVYNLLHNFPLQGSSLLPFAALVNSGLQSFQDHITIFFHQYCVDFGLSGDGARIKYSTCNLPCHADLPDKCIVLPYALSLYENFASRTQIINTFRHTKYSLSQPKILRTRHTRDDSQVLFVLVPGRSLGHFSA